MPKWLGRSVACLLLLFSIQHVLACGEPDISEEKIKVIETRSSEELASLASRLDWGNNSTVYLILPAASINLSRNDLPIQDKDLSSVPQVKSNMSLGFTCLCGTCYRTKPHTQDCCEEDPETGYSNRNCASTCKNCCNSEWNPIKGNWDINKCDKQVRGACPEKNCNNPQCTGD